MDDFEFFWLTYYEGPDSGTFAPYKPAILTEKFTGDGYEQDIYSFDVENHSLYIRCRYYMEWEPLVKNDDVEGPGEKQSKFSDWSESAIFGKNTTQIVPDEPTTYEAPVISDLKIVPLGENEQNSHIEYVQTTPESVWMTGVYYLMKEEGQFDGLETQVSIDGGEWIEFDTADAGGDWCLWNGNRSARNFDVTLEENTNVKLRIRFTGTHGPSEWSNVLEINGGGTQEFPDTTNKASDAKPPADEKDKCSICGFCPVPLGLCIFIWIAIVVVVILVVVIFIMIATKKKKCPGCKTKCKKNDKCCPNCGQQLK